MSWEKSTIIGPVPQEVKDALESVNDVLSTLSPILDAINALLEIVKTFIGTTLDPFSGVFAALLTELENIINDFFGTGVSILVVNPFKVEGIRNFDDLGFPLLSASEAIQRAISSFDDLGDSNRPQFSDSAEVVAFGLLVTAPDLAGFLASIEAVNAVFKIPEWELILEQAQRRNTVVTRSQLPDWQTLKLNSIESLRNMQQGILELVEIARGAESFTDSITDLITVIQLKIQNIQAIIDRIQAIIDSATNTASGIFVFDLPPGVGGNSRIKTELSDPFLNVCGTDGYSALALFVGGGPSLTPVDNVRKLLL